MSWEVLFADPLTGDLGAQIDGAAKGTWSDAVNAPQALTGIETPTPGLLSGVERRWWSPWSGTMVACWDGEPVVWGPILDEPAGDDKMSILSAGGFASFLSYRVVTAGNLTDGKTLAESVVAYRNLSLGSIVRRLVEQAQDRPSGWWPLVFASPQEETGHERTYPGFNLGNNSVLKRLEELSEVINGPDWAFRPRWREQNRRLEWAMFHGTEAMPEIATPHSMVIDLTAARSKAVVKAVTAKSLPLSRVYATGAGQDQGTLIRVADRPTPQNLPFLESVVSDTQTENADLLTARARGVLEQGRTVQLSVSVSAHDYPPHTWWAGDAVTVHWPDGWTQLAKGTYRMRCIARSGTVGSHMIDLELQPEGRIG